MKSRFYKGLRREEERRLYDSIRGSLRAAGFTLKIIKRIGNNENWLGSFSEEDKEIVVFYKPEEEHQAVLVLAHEYSHFVQSQLKTPAWTLFQECHDLCPILNEVLKSSKEGGDIRGWLIKKFKIKDGAAALNLFIEKTLIMERECEELTLLFLDQFNVEFDKKAYLEEVERGERRLKNFLFFGYYWH
jgi:hypothetical protein